SGHERGLLLSCRLYLRYEHTPRGQGKSCVLRAVSGTKGDRVSRGRTPNRPGGMVSSRHTNRIRYPTHRQGAVMTNRWGITIPFEGLSLLEQKAVIERMPDLGYTDAWSAEANATDAFTPLALASQWAPELRLGTAIVPAYTRGPATLAMSAATMAAAAPGRFAL